MTINRLLTHNLNNNTLILQEEGTKRQLVKYNMSSYTQDTCLLFQIYDKQESKQENFIAMDTRYMYMCYCCGRYYKNTSHMKTNTVIYFSIHCIIK